MNRTNLIVLRKTPYRETSLVVAGITPEMGRLDMLVKGAKKLSAKSFPAVDLFREIDVEINPQNQGLHSVYSADLITNFDNIASVHKNYLAACDIAAFVLRNSKPDVPSPEVYKAVKNIFSKMAKKEMIIPTVALIKLVYLDEHGLLPEIPDGDFDKTKLQERLIGLALGKNGIPEINQAYWQELSDWIDALCHFHELS